MPDLTTNTVVMLVAAFWGAIGGIIYWAVPKQPSGTTEFLKRFSVGAAVGAITNVLGGVAPFDAAGNWDSTGVGKLIAAGLVGLSAVATYLPTKLNENYREKLNSQGT